MAELPSIPIAYLEKLERLQEEVAELKRALEMAKEAYEAQAYRLKLAKEKAQAWKEQCRKLMEPPWIRGDR